MERKNGTDQQASVGLTVGHPQVGEIREHLGRVLASRMFRNSLRSRKFIEYIVESALNGQSDQLKERTLGIEVFGREAGYDTGDDAVVRVTAGDVRKRLREYYTSTADFSAVRIDLPSGSYVPEFHFAKPDVTPAEGRASSRSLAPLSVLSWFWADTPRRVLLMGCLLALGWIAGTLSVRRTPEPYGGTSWPLPGTVQVENFDTGGQNAAYYTKYNTNLGGLYRTSEGVSIEITRDVGDGYDVGWTTAGGWLNFTVNVIASGNYIIQTRVSCNGGGGTFHYTVDGATATSEITVPDTGGWQVWTTVPASINLSAGKHIIRLMMDTVGSSGTVGNFNWFSVDRADATPTEKIAH